MDYEKYGVWWISQVATAEEQVLWAYPRSVLICGAY